MLVRRTHLNHLSLSLACLLTPKNFAAPVGSFPHKAAHRHNASRAVASGQAGRQGSMSLQYVDPIVVKSRAPHTATVIMFHGLGDSGHGWASTGSELGGALPHVKWIFPNAPNRPITINGGMRMPGWYDIMTLDKIAFVEDEQGLQESSRYMQNLIAAEVAAGIPAERVLIAGFSQGGALSLLSLRASVKLAGVVGLSCYLPLASAGSIVSPENKSTPLLMCHGTADPVVRYEFGKLSYDKLQAAGANVSFEPIDGMGHTVYPAELQRVTAFLKECLPTQS